MDESLLTRRSLLLGGVTAAMRQLHVLSVSIALIDDGHTAWAKTYGDASVSTLYQAASLSKVVAAVAALRLVDAGKLGLDTDVDAALRSWHLPRSRLTRLHPVTLRGLLSMTGGINVPGYGGYSRGAAVPDLRQILDGTLPANSPPVRVERVPGSAYGYSGGGFEIVQAMVEDATGQRFAEAAARLVLRPAGMTESTFDMPHNSRVARGHEASGAEIPGGWRVMPELAAGGLWSCPGDLARLLIAIARSWRGEVHALLSGKMAKEMLTRQNGGPYGLGAAAVGSADDPALMKRGQNRGYQSYMLVFPARRQGMVVMTDSDNGTTLATSLIRRTGALMDWRLPDQLPD
jgi:CubicO group peptidase (beta-lactamase class C family)